MGFLNWFWVKVFLGIYILLNAQFLGIKNLLAAFATWNYLQKKTKVLPFGNFLNSNLYYRLSGSSKKIKFIKKIGLYPL
jgi:hypothetical protein